MKHTTLILFLLISLVLTSRSQSLQIFAESKKSGAVLYARNSEFFPSSIVLNLDLRNMAFSEGEKTVFVIPAKSEKYKIGEVTAEPNKAYKYSYKVRSAMGDVTMKPDLNYIYDLPFQKGNKYKLGQGYNGSSSHKNENSLDFMMPIGTDIVAARDGVVVQVVQNNTESCMREECKKFNNYITVMHDDGTFAGYVHIKFNGALCKIGDRVKKGDKIALSGDVGYASGPHLHFMCFQADLERMVTLETKFRINNGSTVASLSEGNIYYREY